MVSFTAVLLYRSIQRVADAIALSISRPVSPSYMVKRVNEAPLASDRRSPSLRPRHFVYESLPDPHAVPKIISVFLTEYVPDLGRPGEVVHLEDHIARRLIVCKSGLYATPENMESVTVKLADDAYSTKYVGTAIALLSKTVIKIPMNIEEPWTLEPWHVRTAFRLTGIQCPETAIKMPHDTISGPLKSKDKSEFTVDVTLNNKEVVTVQCQIVQPLREDDFI